MTPCVSVVGEVESVIIWRQLLNYDTFINFTCLFHEIHDKQYMVHHV